MFYTLLLRCICILVNNGKKERFNINHKRTLRTCLVRSFAGLNLRHPISFVGVGSSAIISVYIMNHLLFYPPV